MSTDKKIRRAGGMRTFGVLILLLVMWSSNPGNAKIRAKFGDRFQTSYSYIFFTVISVAPLPGSALHKNNQEKIKTHDVAEGMGSSEYHVGVFGHVF